jgi:cycloeucalenol cycloisomerase
MFEKFLSQNSSKRYSELFFFFYGFFWITYIFVIVVTEYYENRTRLEWLLIGVIPFVPMWIIPLIIPSKSDKNIPITQRHWFKVNIWIVIFSFIGNYFWTHYFYKVLGAKYILDTYNLNNVPIVMYLLTHAYFTFYHSFMNMLQRYFFNTFKTNNITRSILYWFFIIILSYTTAYLETWSIESFPYYAFEDRSKMYSIGSIFYSLCFVISFPLFKRIDEDSKWSLERVSIESLAAGMLVLCLFDFWRIIIGPLNNVNVSEIPFISIK